MVLRAASPGPVDLLALHQRFPERYPFLLQSAADHPQSGRYDLLFAFPGAVLELRGSQLRAESGAVAQGDFFAALSQWFRRDAGAGAGDLPFAGGWFLVLGYEAVGQIEPRLRLPPSPYRLPDALAVRCPAAIVHDRKLNVTELIAEHDRAQLDAMRDDVCSTPPPAAYSAPPAHATVEEDPATFLAGVEAILEFLRAGDVFQVNLSRLWRASLSSGASYADVYRALRAANPAPFAGLAHWQGSTVLSSSPERLVQIAGDRVQTRPIAGTHARSRDPHEDRRQLDRLLASLKERAEHIMLIDLERNDLGRVCEPGSVRVSELMTAESYAHVHHIVSNVTGRLRASSGPGEVLRAVFPGGTITGCPKVRAMEIIGELEKSGRGPYTGAMGYLCRSGKLDMNILIRSLVCEDGVVSLRAGAGIVADSEPLAELAETRAKARGLLLALGGGA